MTKFMFEVRLGEAVLETVDKSDPNFAIPGTVATNSAWRAGIFKQGDSLQHPHTSDNPVVRAIMVLGEARRRGEPRETPENLEVIERAWNYYAEPS